MWNICMQAIFPFIFPPSLTLFLCDAQFCQFLNFVLKNVKFSFNFHIGLCFNYFANNIGDKWIQWNTSWDWIHTEASRAEMFSAWSLQSKLSRRRGFKAEQTSLSGVLPVQRIMFLVYLLFRLWILSTFCKLLRAWNSTMPLMCQWPGGNFNNPFLGQLI